MLNSIDWIEHLAWFERNPVKSTRKPYVLSIFRKARSLTHYKPENKGKTAIFKHDG